jgi:hypothetical protein
MQYTVSQDVSQDVLWIKAQNGIKEFAKVVLELPKKT